MPSPRPCIVEDCPGRDSEAIRLFTFPKDCIEEWCKNIGIPKDGAYIVNASTRICSRHFETKCLGERKLKEGSMPTLNLGKDPKTLIQSSLKSEKHRRCWFYCAVPGCRGAHPPLRMFSVPRDERRRKKFLKRCKLQETYGPIKICELHFSQKITRRQLGPKMYPDINLPTKRVPKNVKGLLKNKTQQEDYIPETNSLSSMFTEDTQSSKRPMDESTIQPPSPRESKEMHISKLKGVIEANLEKIKNLRQQIKDAKKRLSEASVIATKPTTSEFELLTVEGLKEEMNLGELNVSNVCIKKYTI